MNGHFNFGEINPLKYFLGVSIGLGILFAYISGADGEGRTLMVFAQWQLQTVIPVLILIQCHCFLAQHTALGKAPLVWQFTVSGVLGATVFTPIALAIDWALAGELEEPTVVAALIDEWSGVTFPVTVSWMLMNIPLIGGLTIVKSAPEPETDKAQLDDEAHTQAPSLAPAFLNLCTSRDLNNIEALQAELHYISVIRPQKSELILYSLKDAVNELPASMGWRIHRSCWIAFDHVESIKAQGRQGVAITKSGNRYAIIRSQYADFYAAWTAYNAN